jgi:uncharacterized protein (DUF58 family)
VSGRGAAPALTPRGAGMLAAGVAALVASRGFGTPALTTLGIGLLALPPLAAALVGLVAGGMRLERRVLPDPARAGEPLRVALRATGWPARARLTRLADLRLDAAAAALGAARAERADAATEWSWRVLAPRRGEHRLAAPALEVLDPLGLCRARRPGAPATVLVLPRAPALAGLAVLGGQAAPAARGREPDWGELERVRDYRPGDPFSRVHWAQTAKRGRLQTKELRAAAADRAAIGLLLDARAPAGEGTAGEDAVTAAAAIARHLSGRGLRLAFAHTGGRALTLAPALGAWAAVEPALARVGPSEAGLAGAALPRLLAAWPTVDAVLVVSAAFDGTLPAAAARASADGVRVAAVLVGEAAAASAPALRRAGAAVVTLAEGEEPGPALARRPVASAPPPADRVVA